jgi:glycopeptide antibiotics resistance protein
MRAKIFHAHNAKVLARRFAPVGRHLPVGGIIFFCFLGLRFEKCAQKFFMHTMQKCSRGDLHLSAATSLPVELFFFVFWD